MANINIQEAQKHLSELIDRAQSGEEIFLCKEGKPIAIIIPYPESANFRKPGLWSGKVEIAEDFDELPQQMKKYFE
jgi:prevent-host-death family protein